jgi:hypothetical protein
MRTSTSQQDNYVTCFRSVAILTGEELKEYTAKVLVKTFMAIYPFFINVYFNSIFLLIHGILLA